MIYTLISARVVYDKIIITAELWLIIFKVHGIGYNVNNIIT